MTTLMRRQRPSVFADLSDWLETGIPGWLPRRADGNHLMRIEDEFSQDRYVVRTEIPGVDPQKDLQITVERGVLNLKAERRAAETDGGRSEFRYGVFERSVTLPEGADEDDIQASYENGIVEISVGLREGPAATKTIPIAESNGAAKQISTKK